MNGRTPVAVPARRLRRARNAALVWGLFLFGLTSYPSPPSVPILSGIPDIDKIVHFGLYGVEAFLLYFAIRWPGRADVFSLGRVLTVVGAIAVWGILDETHQFWIPGRSMEGADVVGDVSGAIVGAVLASGWSARKRRPEQILRGSRPSG